MEKIYSMFLRLITDYKHLVFSEEELKEEFGEILEGALMEVQIKGVMEDVKLSEVSYFVIGERAFNRELTSSEQYILAHASVFIWLQPMVNSAELLAAQLTSSDFNQFSNSNRISGALRLYNSTSMKLCQLLSDYDCQVEYKSLKKKKGE